MHKLVKQMDCFHCDGDVKLEDDRHVWEDGSHAFCPRQLKLKPMEDMKIGNNQQVYSSQWRNGNYVACAECGQMMHWHTCWLDLDGGQKHHDCLSKERLAQLYVGGAS